MSILATVANDLIERGVAAVYQAGPNRIRVRTVREDAVLLLVARGETWWLDLVTTDETITHERWQLPIALALDHPWVIVEAVLNRLQHLPNTLTYRVQVHQGENRPLNWTDRVQAPTIPQAVATSEDAYAGAQQIEGVFSSTRA